MTVQMRAPSEPVIGDPIALDEWLAAKQHEALRRAALTYDPDTEAIAGVLHGAYTDLRQDIASWVESAREDAARTAEEDRER
jgi:hypothetical protein